MKILPAVFAIAGLAAASPITFIISGTVNGSLNGTAFTGATITFTQVTDTTGVVSCGSTAVCTTATLGNSVTISGIVGSVTLNDPTYFFDEQGADDAGFADSNTADIFVLNDPSFATYGLQTAFGPLVNAGLLGSQNIPTSGGALIFGNVGNNETFTAVTSAVPEPGSLGLLMMGALGLGFFIKSAAGLRLPV